jgi:hypothetical protein
MPVWLKILLRVLIILITHQPSADDNALKDLTSSTDKKE